jgi:putative ATPase
MRREGYGKGYRYPHEFPEHFIDEQYLPDRLSDARFYRPSVEGVERSLRERLRRLWQGRKPEVDEDPQKFK